MNHRFASLLLATTLVACSTADRAPADADTLAVFQASDGIADAANAISADSLLQHIKELSADSMEGRAPGTPGEEKAVAYITRQFQALGLKPGNPDGSCIQNVDLLGYKAHPTASFTARGKTVALRYPDDYIAN